MKPRLYGLALAAFSLALYARTAAFPFIDFDDNRYVTENPVVQAGLSWSGVAWAFRTFHASNWHPLTWLSLMMDAQLFGTSAAAMHVENALLHALNAAVVFFALRRMTGEAGRSFWVAALFAAHPLRVESVAWVAERKDVLSSLFGLGALWAYAAYAERPSLRRGLAVFGLFALSLLAKPMWVTLPLLFVVLDRWPLRRGWRVREKLPLFALSIASCIVTVAAQRGAMTGAELGLPARVANALVAYVLYLWKTIWPWPLAIHYPYPASIPAWQVAGAVALLGALTLVALQKPWRLAGWLWFLGTLVPVIGLVQVGAQSMADRYAYLPHIGLFVAIVWELRARVLAPAVAALSVVTLVQQSYWRSHVALFEHSLAVSPDDAIAHGALSQGLRREGRLDEALQHAQAAVRLAPQNARHWNNLGAIERDRGLGEDSLRDVAHAVALDPAYPLGWRNLGQFAVEAGRVGEGAAALEQAQRLAPDDPQAAYLLGDARLRQGRLEEAASLLRDSLRLRPAHAAAWNLLGIALPAGSEDAVEAFRSAARAEPANAVLWRNLGIALVKAGRAREAAAAFGEALRIEPANADVLARLKGL